MTSYVRGQTIRWTHTFTDADGAPYTPSAPVLVVDYPSTGTRRGSKTITLQSSGATWIGSWDSAEAARGGVIYWTVYVSASSPHIAADGEFNLTGNRSNLEAVATP